MPASVCAAGIFVVGMLSEALRHYRRPLLAAVARACQPVLPPREYNVGGATRYLNTPVRQVDTPGADCPPWRSKWHCRGVLTQPAGLAHLHAGPFMRTMAPVAPRTVLRWWPRRAACVAAR